MFAQVDVDNWVHATGDARLNPYRTYFFQVAFLYLQADPGMDGMFELAVRDAIGILHHTRGHLAPAAVRAVLLENLDSWATAQPAGVAAVALPAVAAPAAVIPAPPPLQAFAVEKAKLARWRTRRTTARGRDLAAQATQMQDWFHWVSSGPVPTAIPAHLQAMIPQAAEPFKPREVWGATQKDVGWETHDPKQNDFAHWVNHGYPVPAQNSWMNCWECVFFTAFAAGLVTPHWLSLVHDMATGVARGKHAQGNGGGTNYFNVLNNALGFRESVPMALQAGLIPRTGDILFFDGNSHVAISLGRQWRNGKAEDMVMSLWHHNQGRNALLTLEDMPAWLLNDVRFAPCPF